MTMRSVADWCEQDDAWLEAALQRHALDPSPALRSEIVEHANWIAVRAARRFADYGEPFDDLVQVARIGLLKAIDGFDPSRGIPFGGYAMPTVAGELRRHFRDHTWMLHVSRRAKDLRPVVRTVSEQLGNELGRLPRVDEVAVALRIDVDAVAEVQEAQAVYRVSSLDAVPVGRQVSPEANEFDAVVDRDMVARLLRELPTRERTILQLRFTDELTQAEIADRLGLSQVHVGRLINATLSMLRGRLAEAVSPDAA